MDPSQENIERFNSRFLSRDGHKLFCGTGNCLELLQALSVEDMEGIEQHKIYFNPVFSPAAQTSIWLPLETGSNIISFDLNVLKVLQKYEVIAVILYELGHVFNPGEGMEQKEFNADDFAKDRGYGASNASSLRVLQEKCPNNYPAELTARRIARMESKLEKGEGESARGMESLK